MNNLTKSSQKKQSNQNSQALSKGRLLRLKRNDAILGEPDIITVCKIKLISSLFTKQKKHEQITQFFVNGILFPTTAHFSTYISGKYQHNQGKNINISHIKAKLYMFDAFQEKDIQVQINIPGSLEIKSYNLKGHQIKYDIEDYDRAYYSSYLRSLQPMNYPNIVLNPYNYKIETHKQILPKIVPFSFQNSLRQLNYQICPIYTSQLQYDYQGNLVLEIIINFAVKNNFWVICDQIINLVERQAKNIQFKDINYLVYKLAYYKKDFIRIIKFCSSQLLANPNMNHWKQLQIECLNKMKNFKAIDLLGQNLIFNGGSHMKIYYIFCISLLEQKEYKKFIRTFNTILTLYNQNEVYSWNVTHKTKRLYLMDIAFNKGENISAYPQLCFFFDNDFLNRQNRMKFYRETLKSNENNNNLNPKLQLLEEMFNLIERVDQSLQFADFFRQQTNIYDTNNIKQFYKLLVKFEKSKGWSEVIKVRQQCFWLEKNTQSQKEEVIMAKSTYQNKNISEKIGSQKKIIEDRSNHHSPNKGSLNLSFSFKNIELNNLQTANFQEIQMKHEDNEEQFDESQLSQRQQNDQIEGIPACSKRVSRNINKKLLHIKTNQIFQNKKILCCYSLEKLFIQLYEDLKLQIELEKWANKINLSKISEFTPQKRQLFAIIFIKKAFLHLKLERYKKCEEALKTARRLSQSVLILLISSQQLIRLYMATSSMRGVEFYIVFLIQIFNSYGIKKFDIVPEWAKDIMCYIIEKQGLDILNKLNGPFKELLFRWMRNNFNQATLIKKQPSFVVQNQKK